MQILDHLSTTTWTSRTPRPTRWSVAPDGPNGRRRVEVEIRPNSTLAAEFEAAGIEVIPFPAGMARWAALRRLP
jgi:hypothetical protein